MGGTSPEKSMKQTMGAGSTGGSSDQSLIIELLLFGPAALAKRGAVNMTQTSFLGSIGSANSGGAVSPVFALRYILRYQPITEFEIATTNADGTLRVNLEAMA
jgi:hypothetical protein